MLEPTRTEAKTTEELSTNEKAAIILIAMGKEISAQIMRHLSEPEIEKLSTEKAKVENID